MPTTTFSLQKETSLFGVVVTLVAGCGLAIGARRVATPHSALAKDVLMVAGSASRISMSWIWAIASASATLGARLNEIVIVASSLTPEAVALWLSTSTVA